MHPRLASRRPIRPAVLPHAGVEHVLRAPFMARLLLALTDLIGRMVAEA